MSCKYNSVGWNDILKLILKEIDFVKIGFFFLIKKLVECNMWVPSIYGLILNFRLKNYA